MATRVFVRTSERTQFCQCRQRHHWAYREKLKPRTSGMNALVFGSMVHRCMAEWYIPEKRRKGKPKRGVHPAQTFDKIFKALEVHEQDSDLKISEGDDDKWVSAYELGMEMMTNYVDFYGLDEEVIVIYPEMPFQYDIRMADGKYLCTYVGETDSLIRSLSTGKLGLFEHKTAATISTEHLFLDEQASTYWCIVPLWLWENGILKETDDLDLMLYNFMRKGKKDDREENDKGQKLNLDGTVSKRQPPALFQRQPVYRGDFERQKTLERIVHQVREMKAVQAGRLPVYKSPSKDCVFCEFKDLCEADEIGNDVDFMKQQLFRKWNPYKAHIWSLEL